MAKGSKIALFTCLLFLFSFETKHTRPPVKIIQGDQVFFLLEETNRIQLKREEFNFIFPMKPSTPEAQHHLLLTCFGYEQDANAIQVGAKLNELPAFTEEAVFPGNKNPYPSLFMYADGYHDLFYDAASNGTHRGKYVSTLADGELLLEWKINSIREEENETQDVPLSTWEGKKLCLVIVEDLNQNGVIDKGELHKAYITFI